MVTIISQETFRKQQKERLMRRCKNLELRIKLEVNKIQIRLRKILKNIHKTLKEYCVCREQITKFKGRYYCLYYIHFKYYEEVLEFILNLYYKYYFFFLSAS